MDQGFDMQRGTGLGARYGADPMAGRDDYRGYANDARNAGLLGQNQAYDMYRAQALGQGGPSLAELQAQQQGQQQMGQALAMASRGRGGNIAGAQQQGLAAQQYGAQQLNAQQAQLRAAEQAQAQAAMAQLATQMYGQGFGYDQLAAQQSQFGAQNALDWYLGERGLNVQQDQFNKQLLTNLVQSGAGLLGGALGAVAKVGGGGEQSSDERAKTGIRDGGLAATETVGELQPKTYEYKPGYGPPGERAGIMAQDLERTPIGASIVNNTPYGKTVDVGGLASLGVAAASENTHQIEAMRREIADLRGMLGVENPTAQRYARAGLGLGL